MSGGANAPLDTRPTIAPPRNMFPAQQVYIRPGQDDPAPAPRIRLAQAGSGSASDIKRVLEMLGDIKKGVDSNARRIDALEKSRGGAPTAKAGAMHSPAAKVPREELAKLGKRSGWRVDLHGWGRPQKGAHKRRPFELTQDSYKTGYVQPGKFDFTLFNDDPKRKGYVYRLRAHFVPRQGPGRYSFGTRSSCGYEAKTRRCDYLLLINKQEASRATSVNGYRQVQINGVTLPGDYTIPLEFIIGVVYSPLDRWNAQNMTHEILVRGPKDNQLRPLRKDELIAMK